MEVIQGKQKDRKVVIAQEIAFAKVLAGNNKTLRDRAVKKLRKWLTVRGNGKWAFTEEEFLRIWTGLFYCMWMSDKFLVQEELAESISKLIHCFKKNSDTALLFIKCFNKRILMDWEGLDQYRIDKFNMLVRRFLRQTFVYCKEKNWEVELLNKLMRIFYNDVLHKDCSLGFILHFISIYPEELAKVSEGKLSNEIILILIEPFVKLLGRTHEDRIRKDTEEFFNYLMRQTDVGIDFEERFNAWREQGFPGEGPHCMKQVPKSNGADTFLENEDESFSEDGDEDYDEDEDTKPLDPRAGSVHVLLPQIPVDADGFINLFQKHIKAKQTTPKGRRLLKNLSNKYAALGRGKFPKTIKKDPIIVENKKKKLTIKNAKTLLEFTEALKDGPIRTKEFEEMSKELGEHTNSDNEELREGSDLEIENGDADEENGVNGENGVEEKLGNNKNGFKKNEVDINKKEKKVKKKKKKNETNIKKESPHKENMGEQETPKRKKPKVKKKKRKNSVKTSEENVLNVDGKGKGMKKQTAAEDAKKMEPVYPKVTKRKILSNWQVQELDASSPEYYEIKTPKIIRIERKVEGSYDWEENACSETTSMETLEEIHENSEKEILPVFWEKAKAKAAKSTAKKGNIFKNPFAALNGESKSPGMRRISFALDKNMAQENEEYLEEVKNSPKVPFDGSKKPVQSALKSGLTPSPVNPFYRFKKIKF